MPVSNFNRKISYRDDADVRNAIEMRDILVLPHPSICGQIRPVSQDTYQLEDVDGEGMVLDTTHSAVFESECSLRIDSHTP